MTSHAFFHQKMDLSRAVGQPLALGELHVRELRPEGGVAGAAGIDAEGDLPRALEQVETGWRALRIAGELDFSLIGILRPLLDLLADNGISVVAVSTYNTDYILLKADKLDAALSLFIKAGYELEKL